jgi:hypothetical protein
MNLQSLTLAAVPLMSPDAHAETEPAQMYPTKAAVEAAVNEVKGLGYQPVRTCEDVKGHCHEDTVDGGTAGINQWVYDFFSEAGARVPAFVTYCTPWGMGATSALAGRRRAVRGLIGPMGQADFCCRTTSPRLIRNGRSSRCCASTPLPAECDAWIANRDAAPTPAAAPDAAPAIHKVLVYVGQKLEHNAVCHSGPTSLDANVTTVPLDPDVLDFIDSHHAQAHSWTMESVNAAAKHHPHCD